MQERKSMISRKRKKLKSNSFLALVVAINNGSLNVANTIRMVELLLLS